MQLRDEDEAHSLFVAGWEAEDGYFLLEEWASITLLNASKEYLVFAGREDDGDDVVLFSLPWEADAAEIELDDDAEFGYRNVFFTKDGRSVYYTALDGLTDTELRLVPVDGSESPEGLYRDMMLLDVSWAGEPNLQAVR